MGVGGSEEEEFRWINPDDHTDIKYVWRRVASDSVRCRGTIRTYPWFGNRCPRPSIIGGTVCYHHGGKLPNVRKAAQRRLAMAALPAADRLIYMALKKRTMSDSDRLKALLAILDRAGVEGKAIVEVEVKPWQEALQALFDKEKGGTTVPAVTDSVDFDIEGETVEVDWEASEGRE
jgi:hypothetical protein